MFTLSTLIIIAIATLLVGVAVGALLVKTITPGEQRNRELETRLKQTEEQLRDYQQDVAEHFAETSQLVNSLTQSYKEVHQHLAASALKLSNPDLSRQLIDAGDGKLLSDSRKRGDVESESSEATAPRDWAPRAAHGKGQLSEDFGLDTDHDTPEDTGHYNPTTQRGVL
ncbi:MAG TPA: DUF1043 family protein [Spongiibacteraceae bacterium]|nr:DUF1043 family protein [Spongiibacteraceae bacterium]